MRRVRELIDNHTSRSTDVDLFGVILYTEKNPNVKKVLEDADYWAALDSWSGPKWAVFSISLLPTQIGFPDFPEGTIGYMVPVLKHPEENLELLKEFDIDPESGIPVLVTFALADDGSLLQRVIPIDDSTVEEVYRSLKDSITLVSAAISRIADENIRDTYGVGAAVNLAIDHDENWRRLKKAATFWLKLKAWAK